MSVADVLIGNDNPLPLDVATARVRETAAIGSVLTCTSVEGDSKWNPLPTPPTAVTSVTAGNSSIVIGGTSTAPTIATVQSTNFFSQRLVAPITLTASTLTSGCTINSVPAGTYLCIGTASCLLYPGDRCDMKFFSANGFTTWPGGFSTYMQDTAVVMVGTMSIAGIAVVSATDVLALAWTAAPSSSTIIQSTTTLTSAPNATSLTLVRIL